MLFCVRCLFRCLCLQTTLCLSIFLFTFFSCFPSGTWPVVRPPYGGICSRGPWRQVACRSPWPVARPPFSMMSLPRRPSGRVYSQKCGRSDDFAEIGGDRRLTAKQSPWRFHSFFATIWRPKFSFCFPEIQNAF